MADPPIIDLDVEIEPASLARLRRRFSIVEDTIRLTLVQRRIEQWVIAIQKSRFEKVGLRAQKSPEGVPWAELADATKTLVGGEIGRTTNADFEQVLVDSGALRDSISLVQGGLARAIRGRIAEAQVGPQGEPATYAGLHQFGGINDEGFEVPARPFLGVTQDDANELEDALQRSLLAAVNGLRTRFEVRVQ